MKERPILMSAPMVRALLGGTKPQPLHIGREHNDFPKQGGTS